MAIENLEHIKWIKDECNLLLAAEEKRTESLMKQSGYCMSWLTLVQGLFLAFAAWIINRGYGSYSSLLDYLRDKELSKYTWITWLFISASVLYVICLGSTILVQWRWKYITYTLPDVLIDGIERKVIPNEISVNEIEIKEASKMITSSMNVNRLRARLTNASLTAIAITMLINLIIILVLIFG